MSRVKFLGILVPAAAVGGWFSGILYEKKRHVLINVSSHEKSSCACVGKYDKWPGIPFMSVSAATPISDGLDKSVAVPGSRTSQIMKYGFPGMSNIRSQRDFVLSYDQRNRVPYWVFEHLTPESIKYAEDVDRSKSEFHEDKSVHEMFRSTNKDYLGSGYDRGHMAAAGNHKACQQFVDETFVLSNIAPQVGVGFNRNSWNRLEKHIRKMLRVYPNIYVCTGPLYLPRREVDGKMYVKYQVIGANSVAVPTHFFKIVVAEEKSGGLHMESYVMPNQPIDDNTPLHSFQVPPEAIEKASGFLFYNAIPRTKITTINGRKSTWV
ncbi:endonuclease G, mitochondrial [Hetaerina americana]|uniref:endonuclease G, mitochondrial n=1 Tax=Hetaerina americana TaxID=62018 RepID=UPI003A7F12BA